MGLLRDKGDLNVPAEVWKQKHLCLLIQEAADGTRRALLAASSLRKEGAGRGEKRNCVIGGKSAPEPDTCCHVFGTRLNHGLKACNCKFDFTASFKWKVEAENGLF